MLRSLLHGVNVKRLDDIGNIFNFLLSRIMLKFNPLLISEKLKSVFKLGTRTLLNNRKSCIVLKPQINTFITLLSKQNDQIGLCYSALNSFHTGVAVRKKKNVVDAVDEYDEKMSKLYYPEFERHGEKNKKAFLETIRVYSKNVRNRAAHVDFIKACLKHMKEYGVHRDLETYKKIIDVLPKGVYVCTNKLLADGMYYPRQQFVAIYLIEEMMIHSVIPDVEMGLILENIFGMKSHVCKLFNDYFYWTTKFKNKSPYVLPRPLPSEPLLLAKLAIERITTVDPQTEILLFETLSIEDSIDKTWIVSGQSPDQKKLLSKHSKNVPVVVEGGDLIHLMDKTINYFVLRADGEPFPYECSKDPDDITNITSKFFNPNYLITKEERTVHEQDDGIIYAVCATGTSSKDSVLSWVRILQKYGNPVLADVPVLFRFKQSERMPATFSEELLKVD